MSDIAYTVAVSENSYEVWDEEHGIQNAGEGEEPEVYRRPQKMVKIKFTNRVGKKRQCNISGWSTDGIQFFNRVHSTWTMLEEEWVAYEDKTNFGHSSRRKKNEHEEPKDDYYNGGDHCPDLPLWDKFVLLDGDEDFMDERPSSKRMREDLSNQDDTDSDCSSFQGDYDGEQQTQVPRVSLNGDGDGSSDRVAV